MGRFRIEESIGLREMAEKAEQGELRGALVSMADSLDHLPLITVDGRQANRLSNGGEVTLTPGEVRAVEGVEGPVRLCDERKRLIAVGHFDAARNKARPIVVVEAASTEPKA